MTQTSPANTQANTLASTTAIRRAWRITTTCYLCLVGWLLIWHLRILPLQTTSAVSMMVPLLAPLLIAGPGLFRGKLYTYKWMSLVVWLWFAHGVMEAWTNREIAALSAIAALEPILAVLLFIGLLFFLRAHRDLTTTSA